MKQMEVHIMQQSYMLGCPEGQEERLMAAVKHVDEAMCGIRDTGKIRGRERIAVLAALNLAYSLIEHRTMDGHAAPAQITESAPALAPSTPLITIDVDSLVRRIDAALGDQDHTST